MNPTVKVTNQEALDNVIKCARNVQGTADFHDVVRESLRIVAERMKLADELEDLVKRGELVQRGVLTPPAPEPAKA